MLISVHVPRPYVAKVDELVEKGEFPTTSDAVTHAISLLIEEYGKGDEKKESVQR